MASLEQLVGTVSLIGEKGGFQIQERPGTYLQVSKFADPAPELPEPGQRVRIGLDTKGFV